MRILDDGQVEIKNKRTGEVKVVNPQDLPSYGIPYSKYQAESTAYQESIKQTPLKSLVDQVSTYSNRKEAIKDLEEYRTDIVGKVGLEGYKQIESEIDNVFPKQPSLLERLFGIGQQTQQPQYVSKPTAAGYASFPMNLGRK